MMQGEMDFDDPIEDEVLDTDTPHCRVCGIELNEHNKKKDANICKPCCCEDDKLRRERYKEQNKNKVYDLNYYKKCSKCGETKNAEQEFQKANYYRDGYFTRCKGCTEHQPRGKFNRLKKGAKKRGYEFTLKLNDTSGLVLSDCYYCGKPSQKGIKIHGLDRIDNSKGYHLDNVVPCCEQCNIAKHTSTQEEFIDMCKRVTERHTTYEKSNMESIKIYLENEDLGEFMKENFDYPVW